MTSNITNTINTINTINTTNEFKINILEKDGDDTITCYIHKDIKIDVTYLVHTHEYMDSISSLCQKKFNIKPKKEITIRQLHKSYNNQDNEYKSIKTKLNDDHKKYINIEYQDQIIPELYTEFKTDDDLYEIIMSYGCDSKNINTIYTIYKNNEMIMSLIDETSYLQLGDGSTYCYLSDDNIIIENSGDVGSVILFELQSN